MIPPSVVVAPDSFKGSLSAAEAGEAIRAGVLRAMPDADVRVRPMADGGEGTLDAVMTSAGGRGERRQRRVEGASGAAVDAGYGILDDRGGPIAVLEAAQVVGITDATAMRTPVASRSTQGLGTLMRTLVDDGVRRFMIGLGGSSTNDGGAGILAALGLALLDRDGASIAPTPTGLAALSRVDASGLDPRLRDCSITIMSDVNNPLCGPGGATAIFGPQKGVGPGEVESIDRTLAAFGALVERALGVRKADAAGSGAAGGLGFALQLIGGRMASGAEVVADLVGLDAALAGATWAITGEGRSDAQTLLGKAPYVVAQRALRTGVPTSLLSGALDASSLLALHRTFAGCFALPARPMTLDDCIASGASLLADRAEAMARVFAAARR